MMFVLGLIYGVGVGWVLGLLVEQWIRGRSTR